jgi:hypothetical protein
MNPPLKLILMLAFAIWQADTGYKVETRYPVPGNGGFDYVTIDSAAFVLVARNASGRN